MGRFVSYQTAIARRSASLGLGCSRPRIITTSWPYHSSVSRGKLVVPSSLGIHRAGSGASGLTTRRLLRRRDARMRFVEINLLGVYVAPISLLMVAAWVVTIGLRGSAARFGLLRHVYDQPKWFCHLNRVAQKTVGRLGSRHGSASLSRPSLPARDHPEPSISALAALRSAVSNPSVNRS